MVDLPSGSGASFDPSSLLFPPPREVFSLGQVRRVLRLNNGGCPEYRQIGDEPLEWRPRGVGSNAM